MTLICDSDLFEAERLIGIFLALHPGAKIVHLYLQNGVFGAFIVMCDVKETKKKPAHLQAIS